jgi:peptidoglycan hydrolase CwlO-like protein|nr:MAG TPA: SMODS and SLOG-associating 2TM effector domain 6 [Caudoviricetes sp.]
MEIWIGLICTIMGIIISYVTFYLNQKKEIKKDTRESAERNIRLELKLDNIYNNLSEIRLDQKDISKVLNRLNEKVALLEQALTDAQKRIEKLEQGDKQNG